ncbi:MAG: quinolinate synthase NadA [Eubacteriales bacterium]|nr:quinolinate synthase NadA [Eubacteriales bacterium]
MENIIEKIAFLKKERNALILAHYYQIPEVQQIADFVGDSFELCKIAKRAQEEVIVLCGVYFMAESVKILSPEKTVLIPNINAGCPMADMIKPEDVRNLRHQYKEAAVVTYINSSAAVKAESDICCTSSNAVEIVNSLPNEEIIFVPDKNLGSYVSRFTNKKFIYFDGYCHVHNNITLQDLERERKLHPNAPVLVHPECRAEVVDHADFVGSTSRILDYATRSEQKEFIIGTEKGILYSLKQNNPDKEFYPLSANLICPNMKKTSLASVLSCLEDEANHVECSEKIIEAAALSLNKMLAVMSQKER